MSNSHRIKVIEKSVPVVTTDDMKVGQIGRVVDESERSGMILLKIYDNRLVNLRNPFQVWSCGAFDVQIFPAGTVLELTVFDPDEE